MVGSMTQGGEMPYAPSHMKGVTAAQLEEAIANQARLDAELSALNDTWDEMDKNLVAQSVSADQGSVLGSTVWPPKDRPLTASEVNRAANAGDLLGDENLGGSK